MLTMQTLSNFESIYIPLLSQQTAQNSYAKGFSARILRHLLYTSSSTIKFARLRKGFSPTVLGHEVAQGVKGLPKALQQSDADCVYHNHTFFTGYLL